MENHSLHGLTFVMLAHTKHLQKEHSEAELKKIKKIQTSYRFTGLIFAYCLLLLLFCFLFVYLFSDLLAMRRVLIRPSGHILSFVTVLYCLHYHRVRRQRFSVVTCRATIRRINTRRRSVGTICVPDYRYLPPNNGDFFFSYASVIFGFIGDKQPVMTD